MPAFCFWKSPKFILWSLFLVLLFIVILQNVEPTQVDLLFWSLPTAPKLGLILISMAVGSLLTLLVLWEVKSKRKNSKGIPDSLA